MKIDDSKKITTALGGSSKNQAAGAEKTPSKPETVSGGASVNVNLSSQLQALTENMAGSEVFDTQKVEEIKAAIADGQFKVDAGKVADSLIETVRGLIQKQTA